MNHHRKITHPTMSSRISDVIQEDHNEMDSSFQSLLQTKDQEEQTAFQNKLTWELARHAVGEELVVYPAIEQYVRDGMEVVDRDRTEHQLIKEYLKEFQDKPSTDPDFIPTAQSLMAELHRNTIQESTNDLVKLEGAITREESQRLARSFHRTKMFLPTRAHPSMPDKPPFETAVGLMTAPVDQLVDIFRQWPEDDVGQNPSFEIIDHDYTESGPCKLPPFE